MGTVALRVRRVVIAAVAAFVVAVPALGHAGTVTLTPAWTLGSNNQGQDSANYYNLDPATGQMAVLRAGGSVNGSLGCAAFGPFAYFEATYTGTNVVSSVTVHYDNALIDSYTWLQVGVKQDGHYIDTVKPRGPIAGAGDVTVDLTPQNNIPGPVSGPFTIEFGINVPSACPNVDGGIATFSSVTITEA